MDYYGKTIIAANITIATTVINNKNCWITIYHMIILLNKMEKYYFNIVKQIIKKIQVQSNYFFLLKTILNKVYIYFLLQYKLNKYIPQDNIVKKYMKFVRAPR